MQPLSRQFTPGCRITGPSLTLSVRCVRRTGPSWVMSEFPCWWKGLAGACLRLSFQIALFLRYSIKTAWRFLPAISSQDRKSTRLSSHRTISYAVFCLKKKNTKKSNTSELQSPYDLACRLLLEKKHTTSHPLTIRSPSSLLNPILFNRHLDCYKTYYSII